MSILSVQHVHEHTILYEYMNFKILHNIYVYQIKYRSSIFICIYTYLRIQKYLIMISTSRKAIKHIFKPIFVLIEYYVLFIS